MNAARWEQAEMLASEHDRISVGAAYVVLGLFQGDAALASGYFVELANTPSERHSQVASRYLLQAWERTT